MNRRILSHVLLALSFASITSQAFAASPPIVTVGDPDVGSKPQNEGDYKSLEKWLIKLQEADLSTSKAFHVRTHSQVEEAIKNKTKVPPAKYVALANIVVLSVDKSKGDESKDLFEVFEDKKTGDLRVPDGRGGGPAQDKPYMLDVTMKLVDIRTSEILAVSSSSFRGSKWRGWPNAKQIEGPDLLKEDVPRKLTKALKDSCQDLAKQFSDKRVLGSADSDEESK
jgi:hypothetical protein